jgi:hypothetical protein
MSEVECSTATIKTDFNHVRDQQHQHHEQHQAQVITTLIRKKVKKIRDEQWKDLEQSCVIPSIT